MLRDPTGYAGPAKELLREPLLDEAF